MAKVEDITVEVKANMTVDKTTAEACLKLVELYINQNDVDLIGNTKIDGTIELNFQKGAYERINEQALADIRGDEE
ncbi:MAG: hypothetical protein Q4C17_04495 [Bacillota bacterium]|nr:hypothetical protein [Bacillota bacterium]